MTFEDERLIFVTRKCVSRFCCLALITRVRLPSFIMFRKNRKRTKREKKEKKRMRGRKKLIYILYIVPTAYPVQICTKEYFASSHQSHATGVSARHDLAIQTHDCANE